MRIIAITRQLRVVFYVLVLCAVLLSVTGCNMGAPGMTSQEVHRRHIDSINTNKLLWQDEIDAWLLLDRPSRLGSRLVR